MDSRKIDFLAAVVGEDGAQALAKAAARAPELEWAILPRVVMGWLEVVSHAQQYDGGVPGTGAAFKFRKSERGFSGLIDLAGEQYGFRDESLYHLAGSVAVAIGAVPERADVTAPLGVLGKSIDLLVRSRTLRKARAKQQGAAAQEPEGQAAGPQAPLAPEAPVAEQPKNLQSQVGTKVSTRVKPTRPRPLRVTKAEADQGCQRCGLTQFQDGRFGGCACFAALAKSVKTTVTELGYYLEFGSGWDAEAVATLAEGFGR